jgi:hypothetical protein
MNAAALATPPTLPQAFALEARAAPASATVAGITLTPARCVEQSAALLRAACQRGQLEDASAAARAALRVAAPQSPHAAMLRALAQAQPTLMQAPEEPRLYLLRRQDGTALGLIRLRDNGRLGAAPPAGIARWSLQAGNLVLSGDDDQPRLRFALCGDAGGARLYLGEVLADGSPALLQELRCTFSRLRGLDPELVAPFCALFDADTLVPATLPARSALLLAAPHCGADTLLAALNRSGAVGFDAELLAPLGIGLAEGLVLPAEAGALYDLRAKDPVWFARMVLNRSHDRAGRDLGTLAVRGFVLAPLHSGPALDWAIGEPDLRIVHLVRSNLLAEFADTLAGQAGAGSGADAPLALHFEAERFLRFVGMKQRYHHSLRRRLVQRDGDTVEIDSSRLNAATLAALLCFLTDPSTSEAAPATWPAAASRPVLERFDNPVAVLHCLDALGQPGWADIEGRQPDGV